MRLVVVVMGLLAVVLIALILWASADDDVITGLLVIANVPWGVVTLVDLAMGLFFAALWIAAVEPRRGRAIALVVLLFLFGNLVTALYLLYRCLRFGTLREALLNRA